MDEATTETKPGRRQREAAPTRSETCTVKVEAELLEALDALARKARRKRSDYVHAVLTAHVQAQTRKRTRYDVKNV